MTDPSPETKRKRSKANWFAQHKKFTIALVIFLVIAAIGGVTGSDTSKKTPSKPVAATSDANSASDMTISEPAPPPPPTPKVYQGTGDDVISIAKPADGAAILSFECPACADNTVVKTNGAESLLVNTIGAYSGNHLIDAGEGSETTQVTITATAAWKLTISGLDKAIETSGQLVSGQGDAVLYVSGDTSKAAVTNTGDENFVVKVLPANGGYSDLPINTIGGYKGTVPMAAPAYVQINSNGKWTLLPS